MFLLNSVFSAPYYITVGSAVIQFSGGGGGGLYNLSCISVSFAPFNLLSSMYLLTWGLGFFLCLWTGVFSISVHTFDWGFSPVCSLTGVSLYLLTLSCNVPFNSGTGVFFVSFDTVSCDIDISSFVPFNPLNLYLLTCLLSLYIYISILHLLTPSDFCIFWLHFRMFFLNSAH